MMPAGDSIQRCPDEDEVLRFLEQAVSAADAARFEAHVDTCSRCGDLLVTLAGSLQSNVSVVNARTSSGLVHVGRTQATRDPTLEQEFFGRGDSVGRYVVLDLIGAGGMGVVYAAYDSELDRRVAVKVIHPPPHIGAIEHQKAFASREAKAIARVMHPNVITVYEVGSVDDRLFIAMEFVDGTTLTDWISLEQRTWQQIVEVFVQAGRGLAAAHAVGVIHRDFKPANAMVGGDNRVRVLDFGLARLSAQANRSTGISGTLERHVSAKTESRVVGTPAYMSPEQWASGSVDTRSDQFSFCVSLFEALYGQRPFSRDSLASYLQTGEPVAIAETPRSSVVPASVRAAVARGLAFEPDERWASLDELLSALTRAATPPRRTRWRVSILALTVLMIVLATWRGVARESQGDAARICAGAGALLDGVWDESRRSSIRDAMLSTGVSYASDTWQHASRRLDAYAESWRRAHIDACEATAVHARQSEAVRDRRMLCLEERRQRMRALTGELMNSDKRTIEHAVRAVTRLPATDACSNLSYVDALVKPPTDPSVAVRVQAARDDLLRANEMRDLGRYERARELTGSLAEVAMELEYAPLLAEVRLLLGMLYRELGDFERATAAFTEAFFAARTTEHREIAARAATELVFVIGRNAAGFETAIEWGRHARVDLDKLGIETEQARLLHNIGSVHRARGDHVDEARYLQESLAIRERVQGGAHPDLVATLNNLGLALQSQGRHSEHAAMQRRALDIWERAHGSDHPRMAILRNNLGVSLRDQGQYLQAIKWLKRALDGTERVFGAEHPQMVTVLDSLGIAQFSQGAHEEAIATFERALDICRRVIGPESSKMARLYNNLGAVRNKQGHHVIAEQAYRKAHTIYANTLGLESSRIAISHNNLAESLTGQGRHAEATTHYQRALAIWERNLGATHRNLSFPLMGLADIDLKRGRFGSARRRTERALALLETTEGEPMHLAVAHFLMARALIANAAERDRAIAFARSALDTYREAPGVAHKDDMATIERWLQSREQE